MAPERNQRRGGSGLPGRPDSDPFTADDGPSRAEVRQRIDSLYDRAETDSRTFNATRARTLGTSSSGAPAARPATGTGRGGSDPVLDSVARQWFDMARGSVGPTVAAALPPDRLPGRSPAALPGRPAERPDQRDTVRELEAAARPALELTAGAGQAPPALPPAEPTAVLPELTAAPAELLPPVVGPARPPAQLLSPPPESPPEVLMAPAPGIPAQPGAVQPPAAPPAAAQPAAVPAPAPATPGVPPAPWAATVPAAQPRPVSPAEPDRTSMGPAKERNRLKLTAARRLLDRRTAALAPRAPQAPPPPAAPARSAVPTAAPRPPAATVRSPAPVTPGKAAAALDFARAQIGRPCLWGAAGPEAYDAAGLVQAAWRTAGVALPRTAREQASTGTAIPLTDLRPGDLLFFHDDSSHVGLVTGSGTMIHAPGPGAWVREESVFFAGPQAIRGATRPA
jgi:cell wall-associated NlpC family hydrolase